MISWLHWVDFETMVDLIFARNGSQRVSKVGGTQRNVDLLLEQPATRETTSVQIKSRAGQAVLGDYLARFREDGSCDCMFFVCHTPLGELRTSGRKGVDL
ncbi:MAG TPA: hypothetical protein VJK06_01345 [Methyloceanibacter sp.]|nr:hypothetical protein [Methyloceanibacter sp.]